MSDLLRLTNKMFSFIIEQQNREITISYELNVGQMNHIDKMTKKVWDILNSKVGFNLSKFSLALSKVFFFNSN
jgi:hypothetical protein